MTSLAAIERLRPDTLYVSTGGSMGPETIATLEQLLAGLSGDPARRSSRPLESEGRQVEVRASVVF
jgi:hypothetical protein